MQDDNDEFDGLMVKQHLALGWQVLEHALTEAELVQLNESNETLLRVCATLDDSMPRLGNDTSEVTQELARFDAKLNLIMEMLGELLRVTHPRPEVLVLEFGAKGIRFTTTQTLTEQAHLMLELYACPQFPKPLRLCARIIRVHPIQDAYLISAGFEGMSANNAEGLEKLVFRRHRRTIALQKNRAN